MGNEKGMGNGQVAHFRGLENLYSSAPVNRFYPSTLSIIEQGKAVISSSMGEEHYHAANAVHGSAYFKMLDDAAFYAANSLVSDRFLLTTAFSVHFIKALTDGAIRSEGKWVSGHRRVFIAESRLINAIGEEVGRGTGTFMRSHIQLTNLPGYIIHPEEAITPENRADH